MRDGSGRRGGGRPAAAAVAAALGAGDTAQACPASPGAPRPSCGGRVARSASSSIPPMMRWTIPARTSETTSAASAKSSTLATPAMREDVEGDVPAEDGVLLAPRDLIEVEQERLPAARAETAAKRAATRLTATPPTPTHRLTAGCAARAAYRPRRPGSSARLRADLDVGHDHDEEEDDEATPSRSCAPDSRPEHRETSLAERQPRRRSSRESPAEHEPSTTTPPRRCRYDHAPPRTATVSAEAALRGRIGRTLSSRPGLPVPRLVVLRLVGTGKYRREPRTISGSSSCAARCAQVETLLVAVRREVERRQTAKARDPRDGARSAVPPDIPRRPSARRRRPGRRPPSDALRSAWRHRWSPCRGSPAPPPGPSRRSRGRPGP